MKCPQRARRTISMIFEISSCCGATLAFLVNFIASYYYEWGWRLSFGAVGIPAAFLCWAAYALVETPSQVESRWRSDLTELLSSRTRPILMINTMAVVCTQLSGLSVFLFFGPFLLESSCYDEDEALFAPVVASAIGLASIGCLSYFLRLVGRRMVLFIGCIATFAAQRGIWTVFFLEGDTFYHLKKIDAYIVLSLASIYAFSAAALSLPTGWLKDLYPARSKPLGAACNLSLTMFMSTSIAQVSFSVLCTLHEWTFCCPCCGIYCFSFICIFFCPGDRGQGARGDGRTSLEMALVLAEIHVR